MSAGEPTGALPGAAEADDGSGAIWIGRILALLLLWRILSGLGLIPRGLRFHGVPGVRSGPRGDEPSRSSCPFCHGQGRVYEDHLSTTRDRFCAHCGGSGRS